MSPNPLLDFLEFPRFEDIRPEHISPAIDELISAARLAMQRLTAAPGVPSWASVVDPLTDATEKLERAWGLVGHLNAVLNIPKLREAYNENIPRISKFWTEIGQNLDLFERFKALAASPEYVFYSQARKKVVLNALRDFRLSGADLKGVSRERFSVIQIRQAALEAKFEQNVLDATDAFRLYIADKTELAGLPEDSLQLFAAAAALDNKKGYKITLQSPFYLPVLQYAENRALREKLYQAKVQRASEFGPPERDNTPLIREKLKLAREEAQLLGFTNFAELSLFTKMAESPEEVRTFLRDLGARSKPFAVQERQELEAFAAAELGLAKLEAWDLAYSTEKLRIAHYAFSEHEVKQYFQASQVLAGLFNLVSKLFGLEVRERTAPLWHPDVRFFEIHKGEKYIASFYLDLYARDGKRSGAWMVDARGRRSKSGHVQTPMAYLVCNFTCPIGNKPALFTHDEVITLFHEFGHGLHHMLTRVDELGVSGINGVEWDAVELPSQFMENFAWEWDVVFGMSCHVDSGDRLPRELFEKLLAAKNFQIGMRTVRQLELALFDLQLYSIFDPEGGDWMDLLAEVRREMAVEFPPADNRFPNTFSHIFAGGYAAGYYSYKWAEVLSADAYAAFEEDSGANSDTGKRFLDEVLAVGGSRPTIDSFRAFRAREPRVDALLRHSGMMRT